MKYEYEDVILDELIKQKGNEIDKSSLNTATFNVYHFECGWYNPNREFIKEFYVSKRTVSITEGCITGVLDNEGDEYDIDYSIYEISRSTEQERHIICKLSIT